MSVQLSILVGNVDALLGLGHTHIEIWKSDDLGNTYQEITGSVAEAASVTSEAASTTFQMGGKLLKISVNGAEEETISFSSLIANWTPSQVVARINEVIPGLATVDGSSVKLTSTGTGRDSSISITYDDSNLGFEVGTVYYGLELRIPLVSGTEVYTFPDTSALSTHRYKWRFSAGGSLPISDFSDPVFGDTSPLIDSSLLSVCTANFVSSDGTPQRTKVIVATVSNPSSVGGFVAFDERPKVYEANASGYMQFTVIRGLKIRVAIEGTTFVREFIVPNTDTFDLIDQMSTATDPFTIQTPPVGLVRRSN